VTLQTVDVASPHVRRVGRAGVLALCDRLDRTPGRSLYAEGKVRFETAEERVELTPPFPLELWESVDRIDTAPLRAHLNAPRRVGLLVVRLGGYGAGVYEDERLVAGKHGVRFVKNRNKKGGSSSNRFRRRRVEQARDAYDRACALAEEILRPEASRLDEFVLAGDRIGLEQVIERSRLLTRLSERALALPVHVPEVRRALLEDLGRELWSSTVELSRQGPAGPDVQVSSAAGA
jgi:peptide subunit release factor 1 (eRF1)